MRAFDPYITAPVVGKAVRGKKLYNPYLQGASLPVFDKNQFVDEVRAHFPTEELALFPMEGNISTRRSHLATLYCRFIQSPTFKPWFKHLRAHAEEEVDRQNLSDIEELGSRGDQAFYGLLDGLRTSQCNEMLAIAEAYLTKKLKKNSAIVKVLESHVQIMKLVLRRHKKDKTTSALEAKNCTENMYWLMNDELPSTRNSIISQNHDLSLMILDDHF